MAESEVHVRLGEVEIEDDKDFREAILESTEEDWGSLLKDLDWSPSSLASSDVVRSVLGPIVKREFNQVTMESLLIALSGPDAIGSESSESPIEYF